MTREGILFDGGDCRASAMLAMTREGILFDGGDCRASAMLAMTREGILFDDGDCRASAMLAMTRRIACSIVRRQYKKGPAGEAGGSSYTGVALQY